VIHVALVSAYPTEAEARESVGRIPSPLADADAPYLGVWLTPVPYRSAVHVFGVRTTEEFEAAGWTREDTP
jgi:hypothetical protein